MRKHYNPAVRDFMKRSAKLLRKGARSKDSSLMWAILYNLNSVISGYEEGAYATMNEKINKK